MNELHNLKEAVNRVVALALGEQGQRLATQHPKTYKRVMRDLVNTLESIDKLLDRIQRRQAMQA